MLNELREENRTNCQTSIFRFSSIKLYRNQASMINRNRSPSPYTNQSIGKGLIKTSQSVEQYSVVVWRKRIKIFEHSFSNQFLIASSDVILIKEFFFAVACGQWIDGANENIEKNSSTSIDYVERKIYNKSKQKRKVKANILSRVCLIKCF